MVKLQHGSLVRTLHCERKDWVHPLMLGCSTPANEVKVHFQRVTAILYLSATFKQFSQLRLLLSARKLSSLDKGSMGAELTVKGL